MVGVHRIRDGKPIHYVKHCLEVFLCSVNLAIDFRKNKEIEETLADMIAELNSTSDEEGPE